MPSFSENLQGFPTVLGWNSHYTTKHRCVVNPAVPVLKKAETGGSKFKDRSTLEDTVSKSS